MAGMFSSPKAPKVVKPPTADSADVQARLAERRRAAAMARGSGSNITSNNLGYAGLR